MRNLSGKRELSEAEILKKVRWAQGLEACEEFHNELLKCKRASVFYQCNNEANLFWNCMNTYIKPNAQSQSEKPPS